MPSVLPLGDGEASTTAADADADADGIGAAVGAVVALVSAAGLGSQPATRSSDVAQSDAQKTACAAGTKRKRFMLPIVPTKQAVFVSLRYGEADADGDADGDADAVAVGVADGDGVTCVKPSVRPVPSSFIFKPIA